MSDMGKRAVVIGATGLVGAALLRQLADDKHFESVLAITRRPLLDAPPGVDNTVVNFSKLADHAELFDADCLFSCLGTTRKQAGSIAAQRVVDVDYQLDAARLAKTAGVKHMLLVSSSGANPCSTNPYLKMKGELEQAVRQLDFDQLAILQPSLLVGPRQKKRPGEAFGEHVLTLLNRIGLGRRYRPISGDQVAKALVSLAGNQTEPVVVYRLDELFKLQ